MLRFQTKPDVIFSRIIKEALEEVIDHLREDLEYNYQDGDGWIMQYFEPDILRAFGGDKPGIKLIKHELEKLLAAHNAPDLYMPTDYHFKLLDRILQNWCAIYSDMSCEYDEKDLLHVGDRPIYEIEVGTLMDIFFWDSDYDFEPELARRLSKSSLKKIADVSVVAINASLNRAPDLSDLVLEKMDPSKDWKEPDSSIWFPEDELDEDEEPIVMKETN